MPSSSYSVVLPHKLRLFQFFLVRINHCRNVMISKQRNQSSYFNVYEIIDLCRVWIKNVHATNFLQKCQYDVLWMQCVLIKGMILKSCRFHISSLGFQCFKNYCRTFVTFHFRFNETNIDEKKDPVGRRLSYVTS